MMSIALWIVGVVTVVFSGFALVSAFGKTRITRNDAQAQVLLGMTYGLGAAMFAVAWVVLAAIHWVLK